MKNDFIFLLGPCALENKKMFFHCLETLVPIMKDEQWWFKTSFSKENRTSLYGEKGIGLEEAKDVWREAKEKFPNVRFTTDFHLPDQPEKLVGLIDLAQVPAFLCRQTDLIVECARHYDKVNIKKGQWVGPNNLHASVDKIKDTNPKCEAWITDRGSNFGFDQLFLNFNMVDELKKSYDRVIVDCTHATQLSKVVHGVSGNKKLAMKYFLIAKTMGYSGLFAETHPNPKCAISDGDCQIELHEIKPLMEALSNIDQEFRSVFPEGL